MYIHLRIGYLNMVPVKILFYAFIEIKIGRPVIRRIAPNLEGKIKAALIVFDKPYHRRRLRKRCRRMLSRLQKNCFYLIDVGIIGDRESQVDAPRLLSGVIYDRRVDQAAVGQHNAFIIKGVELCIQYGYPADCSLKRFRPNVIPDLKGFEHQQQYTSDEIGEHSLQRQ